MVVFFTNLTFTEFQIGYLPLLCHFLVVDGSRWFRVEGLRKKIQLILVFFSAPSFVLHFFCYTGMTFLMMVSVIFAIFADDNTRYCKYDQASDLWQQLELAGKPEFDLQDTLDRKWLFNLIAGKLNMFCFILFCTQLIWCYWCESWWVYSSRKIFFNSLTLYLSVFPLSKSHIINLQWKSENGKQWKKHRWRSLIFSEVACQRPLTSLKNVFLAFVHGKSMRWFVYVGNIRK